MQTKLRLSICAVVSIIVLASRANAKTDQSKTFSGLVPGLAANGLSWSPPEQLTPRLKAASKYEAEALLLEIVQNSKECYAYIASDGDPRPKPTSEAKLVALPVLLTSDEAGQKPSWTDWNRLSVTLGYFPGTSGASIRSFISVQVFSNREAYLSYVPDQDNKYDLRRPPVSRVLTRPQMVEHWNNLPRHRTFGFERDRVVWLLFGISPKNFVLGDTSASEVGADQVAYYLGSAYLLNPYGAVTVGWMTDDGKRFRPGFGVTLDFGILTAIFK